MYIPDLRNVSANNLFVIQAIGWLDRAVPFSTSSEVQADLAQDCIRLAEFTISKDLAVKRTRGIHTCDFCDSAEEGSNSCILLPTEDKNHFFVTNFLLPHYVSKHRYAPPNEFVRALRLDYTKWGGADRELEASISLSTPEGEDVERKRMAALAEKFPHLRGVFKS